MLPPGESVRTPTILARFPNPPSLAPPLGGIPSEFLDETYTANRRGMGLLTRETDTQTDGRAIAYSALSMLSRAKHGVMCRPYSKRLNSSLSAQTIIYTKVECHYCIWLAPFAQLNCLQNNSFCYMQTM